MKDIQMENFRSLKDTHIQKISPITLLVGENSSGKSTFLRAFPLFKQSLSKRTSGPILWAGDIDDYVDFGSFEESITNDSSETIWFRFSFAVDCNRSTHSYVLPFYTQTDLPSTFDVVYKIGIKSHQGKDTVAELQITFGKYTFKFDFSSQQYSINDTPISKFIVNSKKYSGNTPVIRPKLFFHQNLTSIFGFDLPDLEEIWQVMTSHLAETIRSNSDHDIFLVREIILDFGLQSISSHVHSAPQQYSEKRKKDQLPDTYRKEYAKIYNKLKNAGTNLEKIIHLFCMYSFFPLIEEYIAEYFSQVHYIAPLRATAERYYRLRNLAVDEVDYQGKNLAIFINSLTDAQLKSFHHWTSNHFGFTVNTSKSRGHLSLSIKLAGTSQAINLSDTGFGYSQVLPIITQLWDLSSRRTKNRYRSTKSGDVLPLVIAIEQPELHLHPALQAKLAKAFVASIELARENGYQLQLVLETHSPTIVNYLGRAIATGKLSSDDVSVILFEKRFNDTVTHVKNSTFDTDGYLINWPYGFFSAGE